MTNNVLSPFLWTLLIHSLYKHSKLFKCVCRILPCGKMLWEYAKNIFHTNYNIYKMNMREKWLTKEAKGEK